MIDETTPGAKWVFDAAVADAFDDMLARSIPAYNVMRDLTTSLAVEFLQPDTSLVDLGCSRGQAIGTVIDRLRVAGGLYPYHFVGVDVAEPMLTASRSRFAREIDDGLVTIDGCDLRTDYPEWTASVTLAVLTVQFTPIEYRHRILQNIYEHTTPGGVLIIVEKVLGESARLHDAFDREYLSMKRDHGYTEEAVLRKKASLEGVLVSTSARQLTHLLESTGFRHVDQFYRWLNFGGWIAVR